MKWCMTTHGPRFHLVLQTSSWKTLGHMPAITTIPTVREMWVPSQRGQLACTPLTIESTLQEANHHTDGSTSLRETGPLRRNDMQRGWPLNHPKRVMFTTPDSMWLEFPYYFWKSIGPFKWSHWCMLSCDCHQPGINFQLLGWRQPFHPSGGSFNDCTY